ncbi:MAG TPA: hypothetical protein VHC97_21420 [Thermoanaerobaculia bacterium]|jgi:hypothetical protein|nr:hypothetical protein [Thermoanaerobaculia bacterium]
MPDSSAELDLIRDESKELSAEIQSRYGHHYQFHYLIFVLTGALSAAYFALKTDSQRTGLLLAVPLLFAPVVLLMLKEHAYIDLRNAYRSRVLRPRLLAILGCRPEEPRAEAIVGWHSWEQQAIRRSFGPAAFFGLFALAEYLLPLAVSAACLAVTAPSRSTFIVGRVEIWWLDAGLLAGLLLLVLASRALGLHIPGHRKPEQQGDKGTKPRPPRR